MPRKLLLIGDSIRLSYQPHVTRMLNGELEVVGPQANCEDTATTLGIFDEHVASHQPWMIHWNNGLHDIKRLRDRDNCLVPLDQYRRNIEELTKKLQNLVGPRLIWASTTPVIEDKHNTSKQFDRYNRDVQAYNQAAREAVGRAGLLVNDLHAVIAADPQRYIVADGVHLNDEGQRAAAQAVVAVVRTLLTPS